MTDLAELLATGTLIGVGGAALMDVWSLLLRRGFGIATLDYALLGRWIGHFPAVDSCMTASRPLSRSSANDRWDGLRTTRSASRSPWSSSPPGGWSGCWSPTVAPAMLVGLATIVAPWFVMQPAMGAGIAGSKTPDPRATRLRNLGTHAVYGVGSTPQRWRCL